MYVKPEKGWILLKVFKKSIFSSMAPGRRWVEKPLPHSGMYFARVFFHFWEFVFHIRTTYPPGYWVPDDAYHLSLMYRR